MSPIRSFRTLLVAAAAVALAATAAPADDRALLRTGGGNPMVFILLDTSGSMNWASTCTDRDMQRLYDDDGDDPTCQLAGATPCVPICTYRCDSGDCPTPRNGDDPASKMRQAKEALYTVINEVSQVNFGFATYNQDQLRVHKKHWLYQVDAGSPAVTLAGNVRFPAAGAQEVFGALLSGPGGETDAPDAGNAFGCDRACDGNQPTGNNVNGCLGRMNYRDFEMACYPSEAASVTDAWEMEKSRRIPRLGANATTDVIEFVKSGTTVYRVRYRPNGASAAPGAAAIQVDVEVRQCNAFTDTATDCNTSGSPQTATVSYTLVGDFVYWDYGVSRNSQQGGYVGYTASQAADTCRGWDPSAGPPPASDFYVDRDGILDASNHDRDAYNGYSLKRATQLGPTGFVNDWHFWSGDMLPLSWTANNKARILNRLAPALQGGVAVANPFGQASYFQNAPAGADNFLRVGAGNQPPLIANGSTPLAGSLSFFRHWYSGCGKPGRCSNTQGWGDIAAANDPDWECRKKYLLILTDGAETCDNAPGSADYYRNNWDKFPPGFDSSANPDACAFVASMQSQEDIQSIVIAFGVTQNNPKINCLSSHSQPYYVQTKGELVQLLRELFGQIIEETAAFASAAVPTVQANIADKVYLSSFTPLNASSVWPGRLDAFLKPLPLDANNLPDRTTRCSFGTREAECFAWDAGDSQPAFDGEAGYSPEGLLLQAPLASEVVLDDNASIKIGTGNDERRVFFGLPDSTVAGKRQWFRFPTTVGEQATYEYIWNLTGTAAANRVVIDGVVKKTLQEKRGYIDNTLDPTNPFHVQYVMGDIFHSNPLVLNPPAAFDLYTQDLYWNTALCGESLDQTRQRQPRVSYDWFSNRNLCRRVMIFAGSDDGQLHVFDGGVFRGTDCKLPLPTDGPPGSFRGDNNFSDADGLDGRYDFGSGRELFSFVPQHLMPLIKELTEVGELTDQYGADGTPREADVFIDPALDTAGEPTCTDRQWRSVLFGTYREGGPGIFALDITQPDSIDAATHVPTPLPGGTPAYVPSCTNGGGNCGVVPFPALLWEFNDQELVGSTLVSRDEDGVGGADLAESWSRPVVARMKVCVGECDAADEPEDRWVAIFGGGLPSEPLNTAADEAGNWLYIIDVETGRILYKRGGASLISGAVPSDITVVDANFNGLVDTLYFGTTAGFVYKVDLGEGPFELGTDGRIQDPAATPGRYDPFQVFSTGGKPIYLEASAVFVPQLRSMALLFGTGNRWNLWDFANNIEGRFYAIVDTGWHDAAAPHGVLDPVGCGTAGQPLTEACFQAIDPDAPFSLSAPGPNYLFGNPDDPSKLPGWYFFLGQNEKLITEPFALSGITFFTVYDPIHTESDGVCARGGTSKIFTVNTANAAGYTVAAGSTDYVRYITAPKFTTQPFTEQSATGNRGGGTGTNADQWTDELRLINKELKKLFPQDCRFANYTLDIKTIRSDTGIVFIAPVPICIEGHNWKEF